MTETSAAAAHTIGSVGEPASIGHNGGPALDADYWHALIDENEAADFLDLTGRTMQAMRQKGGGPPFVRISARCIKYTRLRCRAWYDARMRASTSDSDQAVA